MCSLYMNPNCPFQDDSNAFSIELKNRVLIDEKEGKQEEHTVVRYDSATIRARAFKLSFISLISLSTSSMNL